jgi:hypothetical protein
MNTVSEQALIFYLSQVLSYNYKNFTIIVGMDIFCEDNCYSDDDTWDLLRINSLSLNFTYEKKIDEGTYLSWNQNADTLSDKLSDLIPSNDTEVIATKAMLNFQYTIDKNWSIYTSSINSEMNIYLNGNPYQIPIKLIDINTTNFEQTEIELTRPTKSVNLSIQLLIKDDFNLDQSITISIDNVTLDISYLIITPDVTSEDGGGGGTRIIRGEDYSWLVYTLTAGIMGLVIAIAAYEKHYKYPPMVRKIRTLKKKIRKGKKVKSLLVNSRNDLISESFKNNTHKTLESEIPKSESVEKLQKGGK